MTATARTVSLGAWAKASHEKPVKSGAINGVVDRCMAELNQPEPTHPKRDYGPWLNIGGWCYGAMWAGVPVARDYWKDSEGAWVISPREVRSQPGSNYIRLSPAPPDAEVQYGFCPLKLDRVEEAILKHFGVDSKRLTIRSMPINVNPTAYFRVDKMVVAAAKLGERQDTSKMGKRFKTLLGKMRLGAFIEDMLRGVYADTSRAGDILRERDHQYREMAQLVAERAYPGFLEPSLADGGSMHRFREVQLLGGLPGWDLGVLFPYLYNIVMPASIFEEVDKNLELGIPPIVPQYVTADYWMFNASWGDPCTGLTRVRLPAASEAGLKIVGGVVNRFNCDIPGGVSYWPFNRTPPTEWVDSFTGQLQKLREQQLPIPATDRADLSLLYARGIPVVVDIHQGDEPRVLKYSKLVELSVDDEGYTTRITTRECSAGGEWIGPSDPSSGDPPSVDGDGKNDDPDVCSNCDSDLEENDAYFCDVCDRSLCPDCLYLCRGCDSRFCSLHLEDHECLGQES